MQKDLITFGIRLKKSLNHFHHVEDDFKSIYNSFSLLSWFNQNYKCRINKFDKVGQIPYYMATLNINHDQFRDSNNDQLSDQVKIDVGCIIQFNPIPEIYANLSRTEKGIEIDILQSQNTELYIKNQSNSNNIFYSIIQKNKHRVLLISINNFKQDQDSFCQKLQESEKNIKKIHLSILTKQEISIKIMTAENLNQDQDMKDKKIQVIDQSIMKITYHNEILHIESNIKKKKEKKRHIVKIVLFQYAKEPLKYEKRYFKGEMHKGKLFQRQLMEKQYLITYYINIIEDTDHIKLCKENEIKAICRFDRKKEQITIDIKDQNEFIKKYLSTKKYVQHHDTVDALPQNILQYFYIQPENIKNKVFHKQHLSLALQGGGAKGLAYIGLIQALFQLYDNNPPIKSVIGSSAGGIIALAITAQTHPNWIKNQILPKLGKLPQNDKIHYKRKQMEPKLHAYVNIIKDFLNKYGILQKEIFEIIQQNISDQILHRLMQYMISSQGLSQIKQLFKYSDHGNNISWQNKLINLVGVLQGQLMQGKQLKQIGIDILVEYFKIYSCQKKKKDQKYIFIQDQILIPKNKQPKTKSIIKNSQSKAGKIQREIAEALTMKQYYQMCGIEFTCTSVDITDRILRFFNHKTTPDLPVCMALQMTGSYPVAFKSQKWLKEWGKYYVQYDHIRRQIDLEGNNFSDGGMLSNFPIKYLDNEYIRRKYFSHQPNKMTKLLGFGLRNIKRQFSQQKNDQIQEYKNQFRKQLQLGFILKVSLPAVFQKIFNFIKKKEKIQQAHWKCIPIFNFIWNVYQTYRTSEDNLSKQSFNKQIFLIDTDKSYDAFKRKENNTLILKQKIQKLRKKFNQQIKLQNEQTYPNYFCLKTRLNDIDKQVVIIRKYEALRSLIKSSIQLFYQNYTFINTKQDFDQEEIRIKQVNNFLQDFQEQLDQQVMLLSTFSRPILDQSSLLKKFEWYIQKLQKFLAEQYQSRLLNTLYQQQQKRFTKKMEKIVEKLEQFPYELDYIVFQECTKKNNKQFISWLKQNRLKVQKYCDKLKKSQKCSTQIKSHLTTIKLFFQKNTQIFSFYDINNNQFELIEDLQKQFYQQFKSFIKSCQALKILLPPKNKNPDIFCKSQICKYTKLMELLTYFMKTFMMLPNNSLNRKSFQKMSIYLQQIYSMIGQLYYDGRYYKPLQNFVQSLIKQKNDKLTGLEFEIKTYKNGQKLKRYISQNYNNQINNQQKSSYQHNSIHLVFQGDHQNNQYYYICYKRLLDYLYKISLEQNNSPIIGAISTTMETAYLGFLLCLKLEPKIVQREIQNIFDINQFYSEINKKLKKGDMFILPEFKIKEFLNLILKQKQDLFIDFEKGNYQDYDIQQTEEQLNKMEMNVEHQKQIILEKFDNMIKYLIQKKQHLLGEKKKEMKRKSKQQSQTKKQAQNNKKTFSFKEFLEKNKITSKKAHSTVEKMMKKFSTQIQYLMFESQEKEQFLQIHNLLGEKDESFKANVWKYMLITRYLSTNRVKQRVQDILKQYEMPKDLTLKQFYEISKHKILFTVIGLNNKDNVVTFINKNTYPHMPVWAAVVIGLTQPIYSQTVKSRTEWVRSIKTDEKQRIITEHFNPQANSLPPTFTSSYFKSTINLQYLTNNKIIDKYFQRQEGKRQKYIYMAFGTNTVIETAQHKIQQKQLIFQFPTMLELMDLYSNFSNILKIQSIQEKFNMIKIFLWSHDNLIHQIYYQQLLRLPIAINTLQFQQLKIDKKQLNDPKMIKKIQNIDNTIEQCKYYTLERLQYNFQKTKQNKILSTYLKIKYFSRGRLLNIKLISKQDGCRDLQHLYQVKYYISEYAKQPQCKHFDLIDYQIESVIFQNQCLFLKFEYVDQIKISNSTYKFSFSPRNNDFGLIGKLIFNSDSSKGNFQILKFQNKNDSSYKHLSNYDIRFDPVCRPKDRLSYILFKEFEITKNLKTCMNPECSQNIKRCIYNAVIALPYSNCFQCTKKQKEQPIRKYLRCEEGHIVCVPCMRFEIISYCKGNLYCYHQHQFVKCNQKQKFICDICCKIFKNCYGDMDCKLIVCQNCMGSYLPG